MYGHSQQSHIYNNLFACVSEGEFRHLKAGSCKASKTDYKNSTTGADASGEFQQAACIQHTVTVVLN